MMRHIRSALIITALVILLVIILASVLRPLLPWIVVLICLAFIVKLLVRS
jgi:hypothetical protein